MSMLKVPHSVTRNANSGLKSALHTIDGISENIKVDLDGTPLKRSVLGDPVVMKTLID
jgi:hypothetical protein